MSISQVIGVDDEALFPFTQRAMQFGVSVPCFGADPDELVRIASAVEDAGWDGFFLWDHVLFMRDGAIPIVDPWVTLAAVSVATSRLRLGTLVTALARRRPWKLARETVTLDRLSGGRLILGVGLGWPADADFATFGEEDDVARRSQKLDEALSVLSGLWTSDPFDHAGDHYRVERCTFVPGPMQSPRIPIWVGGTYPLDGPIRRAARWDGVVPMKIGADGDPETPTPDDVADIRRRVRAQQSGDEPFDVAVGGQTPPDAREARAVLRPYGDAGLTWWIESTGGFPGWEDEVMARVAAGPPPSP